MATRLSSRLLILPPAATTTPLRPRKPAKTLAASYRRHRPRLAVAAQAAPSGGAVAPAAAAGDAGLPPAEAQRLVEFLKADLPHLFDDVGIDRSAYDDRVRFRDPITRYDDIDGYLANINLLKIIFRPDFYLHDAKQDSITKNRKLIAQTRSRRARKYRRTPNKRKEQPEPPEESTIESLPEPQTPRRRRRRRTSNRREGGATTACRRPQELSATEGRIRKPLNAHGQSSSTQQPPVFQPAPRRPGQPPPASHHLQTPLPSPPRPAGAETSMKKTARPTCNQNGMPTSRSTSPRHHGRPEERREKTTPDEQPPLPPRQQRRRTGERRGRTYSSRSPASSPARCRRRSKGTLKNYTYLHARTRSGASPHLATPERRRRRREAADSPAETRVALFSPRSTVAGERGEARWCFG